MDYLRKYLSAGPDEVQSSGAETVEKLVDRVQSATLIDDRRDAMRALKSLSKKFRLEVGTQAIFILIDVLKNDKDDSEIVTYGLESLFNVMSDDMQDDVETNQMVNIPEDLGGQFTEMFITKVENIELILSFVDAYDFHIRRHAVRLITVLLKNRGKEMQEAILMCPMAVPKMMDLLVDTREVIRNDGILLLLQLTSGNTSIQKIVAFENAFERLLLIVDEEDRSDGGVIVEDCLRLLYLLLKNNAANQTLFKEGSFIQRLTVFFELSPDDTQSQKGWSAQKVANVLLMLQVVRTLVAPSNKAQATRACQQAMHDCGLLPALSTILMASGVPAEVLTETIHAVAEAIRGCQGNQDFLSSLTAPSDPPQPAITVLLMSMVNERQPFVLRAAVLYCFQCFLYANKTGQTQVVQTLLPKNAEVSAVSAGQLLCSGLFSHDPLSTWFAAVALLHAVHQNVQMKEELLRVHLATALGSRPVTLLQQCSNLLAQGARFQGKTGLLMLMCTWLSSCPTAVRRFLAGEPGSGEDSRGVNVSSLISEISATDNDESEAIVRGLSALLLGVCVRYNPGDVRGYDQASLIQIISKRIGFDVLIERISQLAKSESYTKAIKRPQPNFKHAGDVVFDYEFTLLVKTLEHEVVNVLQQQTSESPETRRKKMAQFAEHESVVTQFKELIKQQDGDLRSARARLEQLETERLRDQAQSDNLRDEMQKLRDQNALLKAKLAGSAGTSMTGSLPSLNEVADGGPPSSAPTGPHMNQQTENHNSNSPTLSMGHSHKQEAIAPLEVELLARTEEVNSLREEVAQLKYELSSVASTTQQLSTSGDSSALEAEMQSLRTALKEMEIKLTESGEQLAAVMSERDSTKTEHEDLLVLLAEQDTKIRQLNEKVRQLGGEVPDDDEEELDDDAGDESGTSAD